jgi:DNA transposition AAA+ family ATPase
LSHRKATTNATLVSITQAESEMGVVTVISVSIIAIGKVRIKMQIVIEIPDEIYKGTMQIKESRGISSEDVIQIPLECISNGTVLEVKEQDT